MGLAVDGRALPEGALTVAGSSAEQEGERSTLSLQLRFPTEELAAELTITGDASRELVLSLSLTNEGRATRELRVLFPLFTHLKAGGTVTDTSYFFPYLSGWVSDKAVDISVGYGQNPGSVQVMGLFSPKDGAACYTYVKDDSGRMKTFLLRKVVEAGTPVPSAQSLSEEMAVVDGFSDLRPGVTMLTQHLPVKLEPGEGTTFPQVVVGVGRGGWREALDSYFGWVRTWWRAPQVPASYRSCLGYAVAHDRVGGYGFETGFMDSNRWALAERSNPAIDHRIQLAYWHDHSLSDHEGDTRDTKWYRHTCGDYRYEGAWGGLPALRAAIGETQAKGIPVVLYVSCPTLAWAYSEAGRTYREAVLVTADGKEPRWWWKDLPQEKLRYRDMCPQVEAWQDYLAETAARVAADSGCQGLYLDTANNVHFCYSPKHQHDEYPAVGAARLLQKIRTAVKRVAPNCMIEGEDACSEYLLQWLDASWDKTFGGDWRPGDQDFDAYGVHFLRFYLPEIAFAEWGSSWGHGAKRCFFNGMGYCRNNPIATPDPVTRRVETVSEQMAWFANACTISKENRDAFTSLQPVPLIPTLRDGLHVNEFPGAYGKAIYTFLNRTGADVSGELLRVPASPDDHFVELLTGHQVPSPRAKGHATLTFSILRNDVRCIARMPSVLTATTTPDGIVLKVKTVASAATDRLVVCEAGASTPLELQWRADGSAHISELPGRSGVVVKLLREGVLLDALVLREDAEGASTLPDNQTPAPEAPPGRTLLSEGFAPPLADGWRISHPAGATTRDGVLSLRTSDGDVRITSQRTFRYATLRARLRYTHAPMAGRYCYLAFMERREWGRHSCGVMIDGRTLTFQARRDNGEVLSAPLANLIRDQWYELEIVWEPRRVALHLDDELLAFSDNPRYVPAADLPIIVDTLSQAAGEVGFEVSRLVVTSVAQ